MKIFGTTEQDIFEASNLIKIGNIVAFPTETVYGIGANIFDYNAVDSIFQIKNRNYLKPLSAHISNIKMVEQVGSVISDLFYELANIFWPGPLTMIISATNTLLPIVNANTNTIAIRCPSKLICKKFIDAVGYPIAATSANISGNKSATNINEVINELNGKISAVIDGGNCELKIESTVISLVGKPKLIREGAISIQQIEGKVGRKFEYL
jgi:L-threonylcarbamoyladenylate synthase